MEEWIIYRVLQIIAAYSGAKGGTKKIQQSMQTKTELLLKTY